jgi:Tfp pilus assembly protein PilF
MTKGTINRFAINVPRPNAGTPQMLSAAEVNARLAELGVSHNHELQDAMQRARDAIGVEPNNERAWRALAHGQMLQEKYAEALQSVDRLSAQPTLSAQGYSDCAFVLAAIAHHADAGIAINTDDPAPLIEFATMIMSEKDVQAARKLIPVMEQTASGNPRDSDLARSTAHLCAAIGDADCALKFARAWQKYSKTDAERDNATAYLSHLSANIERRSAAALDQPN